VLNNIDNCGRHNNDLDIERLLVVSGVYHIFVHHCG
jgi:hypothetical protein